MLVGRIVVNALALAIVVLVLPGVHENTGHPVLGYLVLGALFGLINAFFKPAIEFIALPLLLGSVGLIVIVIDVVMFWMLDSLTSLLYTDGALWVIGAGVLLGLLSYLLDNLLGLVPPIVPDHRERRGRR